MIEVTTKDLGCWIEGASVRNPIEFSIAIVELAIRHGFEVETSVWTADREVFLNGEPTFEMLEDLGIVTDVALDFLNTNLPEGFYFDFEDGLVLYQDEDEG